MQLSELIALLQSDLAENGDGKLKAGGHNSSPDLLVQKSPANSGIDFSHKMPGETGSFLDLWLRVERNS